MRPIGPASSDIRGPSFFPMSESDHAGPGKEKQPAAELLPVLYAELRRLAAGLTARLPPGQTLQPTALVHEAYLRLVQDAIPAGKAGAISSARPRRPCARS